MYFYMGEPAKTVQAKVQCAVASDSVQVLAHADSRVRMGGELGGRMYEGGKLFPGPSTK